jgi:glutamyl-Q tRNA(Asp) synthetase
LSSASGYVGRFAPSPSGPLHRGSMAAAMASYLDAKAHGGRWLLRIEDIDRGRSRAEFAQQILDDLSKLGFQFEPDPWFQSLRTERYQAAFEKLQKLRLVYPCICSRKEIEDSIAGIHSTATSETRPKSNISIYPGTCRIAFDAGLPLPRDRLRAWRIALKPALLHWQEGDWLNVSADRLAQADQLGLERHKVESHQEEITQTVGDFVIARPMNLGERGLPPKLSISADTMEWTYQLSVVVDDEESGVTHVVRGMDLQESTSRQIYLQEKLGYRRLRYWHCPLVLEASGQKLSKQNGAQAVGTSVPLPTLNQALLDLGLPGLGPDQLASMSLSEFWASSIAKWQALRLR